MGIIKGAKQFPFANQGSDHAANSNIWSVGRRFEEEIIPKI